MTGLQIVNDMQPESVRLPPLPRSLPCLSWKAKLQATALTLPQSITTPLLQLVEERENAIKRGTDGSNEGKQDDADISDSFQVLTKKRQQSLKLATDIWAEYVKLVPGNKTPRETFEAYKKRCVPAWLCCCSLVAPTRCPASAPLTRDILALHFIHFCPGLLQRGVAAGKVGTHRTSQDPCPAGQQEDSKPASQLAGRLQVLGCTGSSSSRDLPSQVDQQAMLNKLQQATRDCCSFSGHVTLKLLEQRHPARWIAIPDNSNCLLIDEPS